MSSLAICRVTLFILKLLAILKLCCPLQKNVCSWKDALLIQVVLLLMLLVVVLLIAEFAGCCPIRVGIPHIRYTVIDAWCSYYYYKMSEGSKEQGV